MLENLDLVLLAMDETVDGGCALSTPSVCAAPTTTSLHAACSSAKQSQDGLMCLLLQADPGDRPQHHREPGGHARCRHGCAAH